MEILTSTIPGIPSQAWPFIIMWTVLMKGLALWRSSRKNQKYWFIVMLILNVFGLLELVYLLFFSEGFLQELMGKKKATSKKKSKQ